MTVNDLLVRTLKDIQVVSKNDPLSGDEVMDAFNMLNDMLDSWAAERLLIYQNVRTAYPLTSGKQDYTIGSGGDFNAVRPIWISDAGLVNTSYTPNLELPVRILMVDEWAALTIKGQSSTQSWYLYNDYGYPLSKLSLWPVPGSGTLQLALYIPTPVTQFVAVTDTVSFPPGYAEAIRWNLAVRLCPGFGKQVDPVVAGMAIESLARVQRSNKRLDTLGVDNALVGTGAGMPWNWLTGQATGMRSS